MGDKTESKEKYIKESNLRTLKRTSTGKNINTLSYTDFFTDENNKKIQYLDNSFYTKQKDLNLDTLISTIENPSTIEPNPVEISKTFSELNPIAGSDEDKKKLILANAKAKNLNKDPIADFFTRILNESKFKNYFFKKSNVIQNEFDIENKKLKLKQQQKLEFSHEINELKKNELNLADKWTKAARVILATLAGGAYAGIFFMNLLTTGYIFAAVWIALGILTLVANLYYEIRATESGFGVLFREFLYNTLRERYLVKTLKQSKQNLDVLKNSEANDPVLKSLIEQILDQESTKHLKLSEKIKLAKTQVENEILTLLKQMLAFKAMQGAFAKDKNGNVIINESFKAKNVASWSKKKKAWFFAACLALIGNATGTAVFVLVGMKGALTFFGLAATLGIGGTWAIAAFFAAVMFCASVAFNFRFMRNIFSKLKDGQNYRSQLWDQMVAKVTQHSGKQRKTTGLEKFIIIGFGSVAGAIMAAVTILSIPLLGFSAPITFAMLAVLGPLVLTTQMLVSMPAIRGRIEQIIRSRDVDTMLDKFGLVSKGLLRGVFSGLFIGFFFASFNPGLTFIIAPVIGIAVALMDTIYAVIQYRNENPRDYNKNMLLTAEEVEQQNRKSLNTFLKHNAPFYLLSGAVIATSMLFLITTVGFTPAILGVMLAVGSIVALFKMEPGKRNDSLHAYDLLARDNIDGREHRFDPEELSNIMDLELAVNANGEYILARKTMVKDKVKNSKVDIAKYTELNFANAPSIKELEGDFQKMANAKARLLFEYLKSEGFSFCLKDLQKDDKGNVIRKEIETAQGKELGDITFTRTEDFIFDPSIKEQDKDTKSKVISDYKKFISYTKVDTNKDIKEQKEKRYINDLRACYIMIKNDKQAKKLAEILYGQHTAKKKYSAWKRFFDSFNFPKVKTAVHRLGKTVFPQTTQGRMLAAISVAGAAVTGMLSVFLSPMIALIIALAVSAIAVGSTAYMAYSRDQHTQDAKDGKGSKMRKYLIALLLPALLTIGIAILGITGALPLIGAGFASMMSAATSSAAAGLTGSAASIATVGTSIAIMFGIALVGFLAFTALTRSIEKWAKFEDIDVIEINQDTKEQHDQDMSQAKDHTAKYLKQKQPLIYTGIKQNNTETIKQNKFEPIVPVESKSNKKSPTGDN